MIERRDRLPDWAERERAGDLAWIRDNLPVFWPAAQTSYEAVGRGAVVVDTTVRPTGAGHPFGYLDREAIEQSGDEDTQRLVSEYDPVEEFVVTLIKPQNRMSTYRLKAIPIEAAANLVIIADDPHVQAETESKLEPPDLNTLMAWESEGGCEAACPQRCWVEVDGRCEHGKPSWLLQMGLV